MSSHHFVREGQEPALVIIDALSMDYAAPLLEWAPLVVVADTALTEVSLWGVKIDFVLIAQHTENSLAEALREQQPFQLTHYAPGRLLQTAIEVLINHDNTATNILIENAHPSMQLPEVQSFPVTFVTRDQRWSMITKHHFEKWLPKDTCFLISPEGADFFEFSGVDISNGVCRVLSEGLISLKSRDPFWIGEFL